MKRSGEWLVAPTGSGHAESSASGERRKGLPWLFSQNAVIIALCSILGGCGYHVAGHSSALPSSIHVIAVPALENKTTSYRIEQKLTAATIHEFLAKTSYKIVSNPEDGDAVLRGKVVGLDATPVLFDTKTGRATTMLVTVKCDVTFTERVSQKVLFHSANFVLRGQYEISINENKPSDPASLRNFFSEEDPAIDRLAQDFATQLVAAVIENY